MAACPVRRRTTVPQLYDEEGASPALVTDWDRVERLRAKGTTWSRIAADPKVDFRPEKGADPGRSLKTVYLLRRSRGKSGGKESSGGTGRSAPGAPVRGRSRLLTVAVVAVLVAAVVGGVFYYFTYYNPPSSSTYYVTSCGAGNAEHYHVLLVINVNGVQRPLPYVPGQGGNEGLGIGAAPQFTNPQYQCPNGELHFMHTHDGSGILHVELPTLRSAHPTLGDFFQIWGVPLSSTQVWTFAGHVTAQVTYQWGASPADYSSNPGAIPLPANPGGPLANPYPIPQSLIFNGQYGGGASAGTFAGEIIWLNLSGAAAAGMLSTSGLLSPPPGLDPPGATAAPAGAGGIDPARVGRSG